MEHDYRIVDYRIAKCCYNCTMPEKDGKCVYQANKEVMCNYICDKFIFRKLPEPTEREVG